MNESILTREQKKALLGLTAEQEALVAGFEEAARKLREAKVGIVIDTDNAEIFYHNEAPLMGGLVASMEELDFLYPDESDHAVRIEYATPSDLTVSYVHDGRPCGIFLDDITETSTKKQG